MPCYMGKLATGRRLLVDMYLLCTARIAQSSRVDLDVCTMKESVRNKNKSEGGRACSCSAESLRPSSVEGWLAFVCAREACSWRN